MYVTVSRLDIVRDIRMVARFQSAPKETHAQAVKRIFWYLNGTLEFGLWYARDDTFSITSYSDVDLVGIVDDKKITSGCDFFLGNCLASRFSKKQAFVSLSIIEDEYIAASKCGTQIIWMKQTLQDL